MSARKSRPSRTPPQTDSAASGEKRPAEAPARKAKSSRASSKADSAASGEKRPAEAAASPSAEVAFYYPIDDESPHGDDLAALPRRVHPDKSAGGGHRTFSLDYLQKLVGGRIELVPLADTAKGAKRIAVVNEEGAVNGMDINYAVLMAHKVELRGPVLITNEKYIA